MNKKNLIPIGLIFCACNNIESQIEKLEDEIAKIDEELLNPDNATNSAKLNELTNNKNELNLELEPLYDRWEELSLEME